MADRDQEGFAAVLACMELDADALLAQLPGHARSVVQNAGGVLTPDAIRSLTEACDRHGSWRAAIVLHTSCELLTLTPQFQQAQLQQPHRDLSILYPADLALALGTMVRQRGIDTLDLIGILYDDRYDPPRVVAVA